MSGTFWTRAVAISAPSAGAPFVEIRPDSSSGIGIVEIGIVQSTAVASTLALTYATLGTPSTTKAFLAENPSTGDTTDADLATAWSAAPTPGTSFYRLIDLPAAVGASVLWSWSPDSPLILPAASASGFVLSNQGSGAAAALDCYVRFVKLPYFTEGAFNLGGTG